MTFKGNLNTDKWLSANALRPLRRAAPVPNHFGNALHYRVPMRRILHYFHAKLKDIPVWTYGDQSPGLILEAPAGRPVRVAGKTNGLPQVCSIF